MTKKVQKEVSLEDYHDELVKFLGATIEITEQFALSEEEIKELDDSSDSKQNWKQTENLLPTHCQVLLTKALVHMRAASEASKMGLAHSLAVQMRVVLECAGQIADMTHNIIGKDFTALFRTIVSDYKSTTIRSVASSPKKDRARISSEIRRYADESFARFTKNEETNQKAPKWRYTDTVKRLKYGQNWYRRLSKCFYHSDISDLQSVASYFGSVKNSDAREHLFSHCLLLDYLIRQTLYMNVCCAHVIGEERDKLGRAVSLLENLNQFSEALRDVE